MNATALEFTQNPPFWEDLSISLLAQGFIIIMIKLFRNNILQVTTPKLLFFEGEVHFLFINFRNNFHIFTCLHVSKRINPQNYP